MKAPNVFATLSKYGSRELENFLTESFVFLIKLLLEKEKVHGLAFINRLCGLGECDSFADSDAVSISTQITIEDGRPDIEIRDGAKKLYYIEIKHDAPLGEGQLEYYKNKLDESNIPSTGLVLLTRSKSSAQETTLDSDQFYHICWYDIHRFLNQIVSSNVDEVCAYFINNFNLFLESKQMSLEQVSWEYIKGVPGLVSLSNILEVAILEAIPDVQLKKTTGWNWRGYFVNGLIYCGIRYDESTIIVFENNMGNSPSYRRELDLNDAHFFSLNQAEQLECLIEFLRKAEKDTL